MVERLEKYDEWARACMHVRCGLCRENCPAYSQLRLDSYSAKGKLTMLYHWLKGSLEPDDIMAERVFACTSCGLCDIACGYEQSTAIQEMKGVLFESDISLPEGYKQISERTRESGNPYAENQDAARAFLESVPELGAEAADYTLFLGCTELYREQEQVSDMLRLLRAAEVSFRVTSENICCGSPVYRVGDQKQAREQALQVTRMLKGDGHRVLASCAGCYRMFSHYYPLILDEEDTFSVIHSVQLLDQLISDGRIAPGPLNAKITYHDPCHLGRHAGIYDEPRRILSAIPGVEMVEMEWNRKFSKCCGAGGGFRSGRPADAIAVAVLRVKEAESAGADILVTACPFCLRNLSDGAKSIGSSIEVRTIESLLAQQL
ncbi:MAG: (Fe-S)-binding protein [Promethearchaeota archaeon]